MTEIGRISPHKANHENAGNDEISVEGLAGVLAEGQPSTWTLVSGKPTTFTPASHATDHEDTGIDEINATGLTGRCDFVDRGDPAAYDFTVGDFDTDGDPHELNLSSIVPAGAKAVLLALQIYDNETETYIEFRKNGNSNWINQSCVYIFVASLWHHFDLICPIGADRLLSYKTSINAFTYINLVVKGWWI